VIAVLAAQAIDFTLIKRRWYVGVGFLAAGLLFFAMREFWLRTAAAYQFDYSRMLEAVYFPILVSLLIVSFIWQRPNHWAITILQIFLIGTLLFTPLSNNFKYFVRYSKVRERYAELFYPLEVFKNDLEIKQGDDIYISTNLKNTLDMLSIDPNDISGMVNFYYDERIQSDDVFVGYDRKKVSSDLINRDFEYALLTASDVDSLKSGPSWERIMATYSGLFKDERELVYLLKR
jgi:hypothetical protein